MGKWGMEKRENERKEWEKIPQSTICVTVESFRGRLEKIIKAKGVT